MKKHQEMKNTLDGINDKLDMAEEKISELNNIEVETTQNEMSKRI